jgi:plasmid stabilization system protein ParE
MKYILSKSAIGDIENIKSWGIKNFGENSAINYLSNLRQKINLIARNPYLYQSVD